MVSRTAAAQPDLSRLILWAGRVLAVVALALGLPGGVLLVASMFAAAFCCPAVVFTGKKDRAGRPTPAHQGESDAVRWHRRMKDMRWRVLTPNADWLPGKDVRVSWVVGLLCGLVLACMGTPRLPVEWTWAPAANGALVAIAIWQYTGSARRFASDYDPHPGVAVSALARVKELEGKARVAVAAAAGSMLVAGLASWVVLSLDLVPLGVFGPLSPLVAAPVLAVLAGLGTLTAFARTLVLSEWAELVATRLAWDVRWPNVGVKDDPPFLVSHRRLGPITVDTFDAPASAGAMAFTQQSVQGKITVALGANVRAWTKAEPNVDGQGQPVLGSVHPLRFSVVHVPSDQMVNVTDVDLDPEAARTIIEAAMGPACDLGTVSRYQLLQIEQVAATGDPEAQGRDGLSPWRVWRSIWQNPDGLGGSHLRSHVRDNFAAQLSAGTDPVQVLVDHRAANGMGVVYIGYMTAEETVYDPATGLSADALRQIETEDVWRARWRDVLKQGTNPPTPALERTAEAALSGPRGGPGPVVHCQPFVTLQGVEPESFFGLEDRIKATLAGAPFVAVTGFPGNGERPGARHSQAFCVYWSEQSVPDGPHSLAPSVSSEAPRWVLTGRINEAFKAARLARPEVSRASCMTKATSRGHIWRIDLRLYGGVTLADVRGAQERIRTALGSSWLRVSEAADGCTLYAGALPARVQLARDSDRSKLVALDWEQAWLSAKVSGENASLPRLSGVDHLPANEKVQVLDFDLPSGLAYSDIKAGVEKLKTATGNAFIEVQHGVNGAASVRLLVCEVNPLPEKATHQFDVYDANVGRLPMGTGVDGEPVIVDVKKSPHLLVIGASGGGKDQPLDARIPVPVSERFPSGWARNGDLVEGDLVFAADGTTTRVVGFSDVMIRDTYRLHLSDGQVVECGPEHLWKVATADARTAHSQHRRNSHDASVAEATSRAQVLRALAAEVKVGTSAPLSAIARMAGYQELSLYGMDLPIQNLADVVALPSGKKASVYDMSMVADHLVRMSRRRGAGNTFAGHAITPDLTASLRERGWLSARSMADHLVSGPSTRSERDLAKKILQRVQPDRRDGTTTFATKVYPVDEVLVLLAERLEARAAGRKQDLETLVTAQEMYANQRHRSGSTSAREAANYAIRLAAPLDLPLADLPVDPYVLGAWLGDGVSRGAQLVSGTSPSCTDSNGVTDQDHLRVQIGEHYPEVHNITSSQDVLAVPGLYRGLRLAGLLSNKHIPAAYLRASAGQRLALLQGLMDTDGTVAPDGGCELTLCSAPLFADALELIRCLGIRASHSADPAAVTEDDPEAPGAKRRRVVGTRYRIRFTTDQVVFRLPRKAARLPRPGSLRQTQGWTYVEKVTIGAPALMRCIKVAHAEHLYLTDGFIPTHNSVTLQDLIYGAIVSGWELYVADPSKGAADFKFADPYAKAIAVEVLTAGAMMRTIYAEVVRRKNLNAQYGVGNYRDLPEEVRPRHLMVVIDEFTSLLGADPVPPASDDAEMDTEREAILASNRARTEIGVFTGKIGREARSAGVTVVLATQKLSAKVLDSIPGGNDVKTNMARILLGKATMGERMSALRAPMDAPEVGVVVPPGRGVFEPAEGAAVIFQSWYDPREQSVLSEQLAARVQPLPPSERLDLGTLTAAASAKRSSAGTRQPGSRVRTITAEEVEVSDMELTWDDLAELEDLGLRRLRGDGASEAADPERDLVPPVFGDVLVEVAGLGDVGARIDPSWPPDVQDVMRMLIGEEPYGAEG
ncbi:hypothetical protein HF998_02455, partial [Cellulomonas hominis]|nr:hypothetical protein [Cellulomonas hominis]